MKNPGRVFEKHNRIRLGIVGAVCLFLMLFVLFSGGLDIGGRTGTAIKELPQSSHKISFATWGNPKEMEILKFVAQEFYDRHRIMTDVFCFSDRESCRERVITQFAAGDPFDVFYADDWTFVTLAQKEYLMDLSPYAAAKRINGTDYYEAAFKKGYYDEKLLGIAAAINPTVLYYNLDLFKGTGMNTPEEYYKANRWNMETFAEVCRVLKETKGVYGMAVRNDWQSVFSIINSMGNNQLNFDSEGTVIAGEDSIRSVRLMKTMIENGSCLYMGNMPKGLTEDELFKSQKVGMVYADYSYTSSFKDIKDFAWDILPFPSDHKGSRIDAISVSILAAAKGSKEQDSAVEFMLFYTGVQGQKLRHEKGEKSLPSLKYTVYNNTVFPSHSNYLFHTLSEGMMEPTALNYLQNKEKLFFRFHEYWSGRTKLDDLIKTP